MSSRSLSIQQQLELTDYAPKVREHVKRFMNLFNPVLELPRGERLAALNRMAIAERIPYKTLLRWFYRYEKESWIGLVNKAKNPLARGECLPKAFLQFWKGIQGDHQRNRTMKEAHRKLIAQWTAWREKGDETMAIPGYDTCPPAAPGRSHPKGWHYANLTRHGLKDAEKALLRQGTVALKKHLPSPRSTRVGLGHMNIVFFDDETPDIKVNLLTTHGEPIVNTAQRPLCFHAIDFASGMNFTQGFKPVTLDEITGKRKKFTKDDFFWFLIHVVTNFGVRADGETIFVVEHGTAGFAQGSFGRRVMEGLEATMGVKFQSSEILGAPIRKGMQWGGPKGGNPNFKAPVEGWFPRYRSAMSHLPGQTGLNRYQSPAELHEIMQYNDKLLAVSDRLTPKDRHLLARPLLEWNAFTSIARKIIAKINARTDHHLEGWAELGHYSQEVRLSPDSYEWLDMAAINRLESARAQDAALSLMGVSGLSRMRALSPTEVFNVGQSTTPMRKLNPHLWCHVVPIEYAKEATVTREHEIHIKDKNVSTLPLRYIANVETARGRTETLHAGEKVRVYFNPFKPDVIQVCDLEGKAIGLAFLMKRVMRTDMEGMAKQYGPVAEIKANLMREAVTRLEGKMAERTALVEHNARVIKGEPVTPEDIAAERAADEIYNRPAPATETDVHEEVTIIEATPGAAAEPIAQNWDDIV